MFPLRTRREIVMRLNSEINKALLTDVVQTKFAAVGYAPAGGTPEEFAQKIRQEMEKWGQVLRAAGIKPQ